MANGDEQDPTDPGAALRAEMEARLRQEMEAAARRAKMFGTTLAGSDVSRALPRNRSDARGDREALGTLNPIVHVLNAAQGVPIAGPLIEGGEALLGSLGSQIGSRLGTGATPMNPQEALRALREDISGIPTPLRIAEQMAFSIPAGKVVPLPSALTSGGGVIKSAAKGGLVGGGTGAIEALLDPNLDLSAKERLANAAKAFGIGGAFGTVLSGTAAGVDKGRRIADQRRLMRNAPNVDEAIVERTRALEAAKTAAPDRPTIQSEKDLARLEGELAAAVQGAEVGRRGGAAVAPREAGTQSAAALRARANSGEMTPQEAQAALDTYLGGLREAPFNRSFPSTMAWTTGGGALGSGVGAAIGGGIPGAVIGSAVGHLAQRGAQSIQRFKQAAPTIEALARAAGHPLREPLTMERYIRLLIQASPLTTGLTSP
ncbi:MAG TPA: hypothetical protein VKD00_06875 [Methyloceanibacter sp.]|nr:hypothetical protein [Methyloceanibacter sp.]